MGSNSWFIMRHGETDWNAQGRLQGRADIPLNNEGIRQADQAGAQLAAAGYEFDLLITSPLIRAVQTGAQVAKHLNFERVLTHEGLIEKDFGEAEGTEFKGLSVAERSRLISGVGESDTLIAKRAIAAIAQLQAQHSGSRALIVAHGTLIRLALNSLQPESITSVKNCEWIELPSIVSSK